MDAIALLKADHREVERLFKEFLGSGARARTRKAELVARMVRELSVHTALEEQAFYPVVRAEVPGAAEFVLDSLEEHHVVKWLCSELDGLDPDDERFDSKVRVLVENVRYHAAEEERELFPVVRAGLGRSRLTDLGQRMQDLKKVAPTHPHPRGPDTPPGNVLVGAVTGAVDRARDMGKKAIDEARHRAS